MWKKVLGRRERQSMLTRYVVGFAFDHSKSYVLLIKKERPSWQQGRFNGIGGHIEKGETPKEAMVREFEEETGLVCFAWSNFAKLIRKSRGGYVYFFKSFVSMPKLFNYVSETDEKCEILYVSDIPNLGQDQMIQNLKFLIPMALDDSVKSFIVDYEVL